MLSPAALSFCSLCFLSASFLKIFPVAPNSLACVELSSAVCLCSERLAYPLVQSHKSFAGAELEKKYILEQRVLGPHVQMDIDEQRYNVLANAKSVLFDALAFEQGYELLLGNFIEMEMAFTEISLRATLEMDHRYTTVAGTMREANRHVINVLTSMRSYVDQVPQLFKALDLSPKFAGTVKTELNDMHFASLDYQFLCELRNHTQHQGTAIHGFEASLVLRSDSNSWAESVSLYANKNELTVGGFKAKLLAQRADKIDVRQCVRMSMMALGGVHLKLRTVLARHIDAARAAFDAAIGDYRAVGATSVVGLAARRDGDKKADVPVLVEWDDERLKLVNKNGQTPRLWARPKHDEPTVADIIALRTAAGETIAQAADRVFVNEARWAEWEVGLPMPQGLFILYQLQVGKHSSHEITPLASTQSKSAAAIQPAQS